LQLKLQVLEWTNIIGEGISKPTPDSLFPKKKKRRVSRDEAAALAKNK